MQRGGSSLGKQSYEYLRNFSITFNVQNKVLTTLPVPVQFNQLTTVTYTQRGRRCIMTNGWTGNLRQRGGIRQAGSAAREQKQMQANDVVDDKSELLCASLNKFN